MRVGEIYINKQKPEWRKHESKTFVITNIQTTEGFADIIWSNGSVDHVGREWIEGDCKLIGSYSHWKKAINSPCFIR